MSAIGPKWTYASALQESAFGGKADMTVCGSPLSWSLLGVKQTWVGALHMSAFDPKRTLVGVFIRSVYIFSPTRRRVLSLRPSSHNQNAPDANPASLFLCLQISICREEHITGSEIVLMRQKTKF